MNKDNYKKALDEIKPTNELKRIALQKTTQRKSFKAIYAFASLLVVIVISISILVPMEDNMKKKESDPIQIVEDNNGLPKVENFDKFYELVRANSDRTNYYLDYNTTDTIISEETNATNTVQEDFTERQKEYSKTNVQVENVDEADIVKTDGNYIYYVREGKVTIIDATNTKKLKKVIDIEYKEEDTNKFSPLELYIYKNNLIVIGNKYITNSSDDSISEYIKNKNYTVAKIYDIEKKKKPKLIREVEIEGEYLSSRMIGENIYLLSNRYLYPYVFKEKAINELNEIDFKPTYVDTVESKEVKCIDFNSVYYLPESGDTSYLNIAGFNITNNEPANIESYLGAGTEVYSSDKNLYVTKVKYDIKDSKVYGFYNNVDINTYIYKFNLEAGKVIYENVGNVPGEVLNQFSMDEKDEYFRIATTNRTNADESKSTNNLYVLDKELKVVGKTEDLAKGEKIYSVRFIDNRAYMVTFVETDPLFVIDLSEPTNPVILGELKIPGYSKYLHPYDSTHLIGFGEDTKVVNYGYGDIVTTDGMKIALFDVSDPNNPQELYSEKIGEKGTYSEILNNHKALLFSKEKNIIAFPISITKEDYEVEFQGAIVYGLDLENGFNLKGKIAHFDINKEIYKYSKTVNRIIYIENSLITLSEELVKATNIENIEEQSKVEI